MVMHSLRVRFHFKSTTFTMTNAAELSIWISTNLFLFQVHFTFVTDNQLVRILTPFNYVSDDSRIHKDKSTRATYLQGDV